MHHSQIPVKPLIASVNEETLPVEEIYFFERQDGSIIHTNERLAWNVYRRGIGELGNIQRPKLVGVGSGQIYAKAVQEAKDIGRDGNIKDAQARVRQGYKEELEAARGKIKYPRNFDEVDRNGNPQAINSLK